MDFVPIAYRSKFNGTLKLLLFTPWRILKLISISRKGGTWWLRQLTVSLACVLTSTKPYPDVGS